MIINSYGDVNGVNRAGEIHLYDLISGDLIASVNNPDPGADETFGRFHEVIGDTLLVTMPYGMNNGYNNSGSTYSFLYDFNGDGRVDGTPLDDIIYGSPAQNLLTGGDGADTFVFQAATAFKAADIITDFDALEGDILDIRDVLGGYDALNDDIADFVRFIPQGAGTHLQVDTDGAGTGATFKTIATLADVGDLDLASLIADSNILIPS